MKVWTNTRIHFRLHFNNIPLTAIVTSQLLLTCLLTCTITTTISQYLLNFPLHLPQLHHTKSPVLYGTYLSPFVDFSSVITPTDFGVRNPFHLLIHIGCCPLLLPNFSTVFTTTADATMYCSSDYISKLRLENSSTFSRVLRSSMVCHIAPSLRYYLNKRTNNI